MFHLNRTGVGVAVAMLIGMAGSRAGGEVFDVPSGANLQDWINVAQDGDVLQLQPGVYFQPSASPLFILGKSITVRGAAPLADGTLTSVVAGNDVDGGSILAISGVQTSNTRLENVRFLGGIAPTGGALFIIDSDPTLVGCSIDFCIAEDLGGGVALQNSSATFIDCIFQNCSSPLGGGMAAVSSRPVLEGCLFQANVASEFGGGLFLDTGADAALARCTFSGNASDGSGGGLAARASKSWMTGCSFLSNLADDFGGGCYDRGSTTLQVDCEYHNNAAEWGGGFNYHDPDNVGEGFYLVSRFFRVYFEDNLASAGRGGGAYCEQLKGYFINCGFGGNTAESGFSTAGKGGGLALNGSTGRVDHCRFALNEAPTGGGIHLDFSSDVLIRGSAFCGNLPENISGDFDLSAEYPICAFPTCADSDGDGYPECWDDCPGASDYDADDDWTSDCRDTTFSVLLSGGRIPDNDPEGLALRFTLDDHEVPSCGFTAIEVRLGEARRDDDATLYVMGGMEHPWLGDLTVQLEGPGGLVIPILDRVGGPGEGSDFDGTYIFREQASGDLWASAAAADNATEIPDGFYRPTDAAGSPVAIGDLIAGRDLVGDWVLRIIDRGNNDVGRITSATVEFSPTEGADSDGDGIPDCTDPCPQWPHDCSDDGSTIFVAIGQSIPAAVNAVSRGGTVNLAAGVHSIDQTIDPGGKALTLRGAVVDGAPATVLDGGGATLILRCRSGETGGTRFENLLVINGSNNGAAGGMVNQGSSPSLSNCGFLSNRSDAYGGGMSNQNASPTLVDCVFMSNESAGGGGMDNSGGSHPTLLRCEFSSNTVTQHGGGIYNRDSSPTLTDCRFVGNMAAQQGGAIQNYLASDPVIAGTLFVGNTAQTGSLMNTVDSSPVLTACIGCDQGATSITGNWIDGGENCIVETCTDEDDNGVPDECGTPCPPDLDGNGMVDAADLGLMIARWGRCAGCVEDLTGDGLVDAADLGLLLGAWGPCAP